MGITGTSVVGLLVGSALAVFGWNAIGPEHPVYAIVVQGGFLLMALLVGVALTDVARSRYRVRPIELRIYGWLGAGLLQRFLNVTRWNRLVRQMREDADGTLGPRGFLVGTERSETSHLVGAIATGLLGIIALVAGHPQGALQIVLVGVLVHCYPMIIQRLLRYRVIGGRDVQISHLDRVQA
ncbi:hypothetical protein [Arthrobacter sp. B1805]|uniref:glycosyl-4,4'-diaponeurosporenoate acyltransferase CrtO family protein n=1 Tax=Arthrobacter sp. B1805 TaxID=2058892 RepID=UPI000CE4E5D3|nr:hypothetical protein [Arthrobacter sp. B1805]